MIGFKRSTWLFASLSPALILSAALCSRGAIAQTTIPPATNEFAAAAEQSGQYEILAAQDALAQSQNSNVTAFAKDMIDDYTRAGDTLRQAVATSALRPPPQAMSSDQGAMLSALQSLRGAEFDQAYARQQVLAHRQALAVTQSYARSGGDANLRKVAQSEVPLIQHHLEMAEHLRAQTKGF